MTIFEWCDKNPTYYLSFVYANNKVRVRVSSFESLAFIEDLSDEDLKDPSFIPFIETAKRNKNVKIQIHKFMPYGYQIYMSCGSLNYAHVISETEIKYSDMLMYTYLVLDEGIREFTNAFLGRDK